MIISLLRIRALVESGSDPGIKEKIMAPYIKWRAEREAKKRLEALKGGKEKKEEPKTTKAGLVISGLLALIYTVVMAIFFYSHY